MFWIPERHVLVCETENEGFFIRSMISCGPAIPRETKKRPPLSSKACFSVYAGGCNSCSAETPFRLGKGFTSTTLNYRFYFWMLVKLPHCTLSSPCEVTLCLCDSNLSAPGVAGGYTHSLSGVEQLGSQNRVPDDPPHPDALATIAYTSGTTGEHTDCIFDTWSFELRRL